MKNYNTLDTEDTFVVRSITDIIRDAEKMSPPEPVVSTRRSYKGARFFTVASPDMNKRIEHAVGFGLDLRKNGERVLLINTVHTESELVLDIRERVRGSEDLDNGGDLYSVHYEHDKLQHCIEKIEEICLNELITAVIIVGIEESTLTQRHRDAFISRMRYLLSKYRLTVFVFTRESLAKLRLIYDKRRGPLAFLVSLSEELLESAELIGGSSAEQPADDEPMSVKLERMRNAKKKMDDAYAEHVKEAEEKGIDAMTYEELTGIPARYVLTEDDWDEPWVQNNDYLRSEADVLKKAKQNRLQNNV